MKSPIIWLLFDFIITIFITAISGTNNQQVISATVQNYVTNNPIDNTGYVQTSTGSTQEDTFCRKYLESCPSDNDPPITNSQPNNNNYATEFAKKYAEKNSNETLTTQLQPPALKDRLNETLTNESEASKQTPIPNQRQELPPMIIPPTL